MGRRNVIKDTYEKEKTMKQIECLLFRGFTEKREWGIFQLQSMNEGNRRWDEMVFGYREFRGLLLERKGGVYTLKN